VQLAERPDADWLNAYRYRGQPLPPAASDLLLSAPGQVFVSILAAGRTVAVARGSIGGGWAGLTAVEVQPDRRRRGLGSVLLTEVARWARRAGTASMWLQVAESNTVARRLYTRAGFTPHHRYDYLREPGPDRPPEPHSRSQASLR